VRPGRIARAHQPQRFLLGCSRYPNAISFKTLAGNSERDPANPKTSMANNCGKEMASKRGLRHLPRLHRLPGLQDTRRLSGHANPRTSPMSLPAELGTLCGQIILPSPPLTLGGSTSWIRCYPLFFSFFSVRKSGRSAKFIGCSALTRRAKYTSPITRALNARNARRRIRAPTQRRAKEAVAGRACSTAAALHRLRLKTPHMPIAEPCPKCGAPFIVEKRPTRSAPSTLASKKAGLEKLFLLFFSPSFSPEVPAASTAGGSLRCPLGSQVLAHLHLETVRDFGLSRGFVRAILYLGVCPRSFACE